jgi:hypothetical protein
VVDLEIHGMFLESLNLPVYGCSPFCILLRVIKYRRIRQAWMVGTEIYAGFWFVNLKDRVYLEYTA